MKTQNIYDTVINELFAHRFDFSQMILARE